MLLLTGLYDLNNDFIDLFSVQEQSIYTRAMQFVRHKDAYIQGKDKTKF